MDYFSVIILVIVIFIFVSDRKIKDIDKIKSEKQDEQLLAKIEDINENLDIIQVNEGQMNFKNICRLAKKTTKEYILVQNRKVKLNKTAIDILIANYIAYNSPCGFNMLYVYNSKKWSLNNIYIDIINYLNIFNKRELSTYGVVIVKKYDLLQTEKNLKKMLISFLPNDITQVEFKYSEIDKLRFKKIYFNKIKKSNPEIIFKIMCLIISGSIITTNLIYSILHISNSISGVIISGVIYYCYSYIIRYIYNPMGKRRFIATYIFPIYFISYIIIVVRTGSKKVITKARTS